jgi:predicted ATPase
MHPIQKRCTMAEQVFVERERELVQLNESLDAALAGQSKVCFVTGEAGSGKTTLINEFARRAEEANADLVVAIGDCNAHTGIGDPYLPFREILGLLTGDVEAKLAQGTITREGLSRLTRRVGWKSWRSSRSARACARLRIGHRVPAI